MTIPETYPHPPGHPDAVQDGCTCLVLDNAHGRGCGFITLEGDPAFVVNLASVHYGEWVAHNGRTGGFKPHPEVVDALAKVTEARAALAELIEADRAYDEAYAEYRAAALERPRWGSNPIMFSEPVAVRVRETGRRRRAALTRVQGGAA